MSSHRLKIYAGWLTGMVALVGLAHYTGELRPAEWETCLLFLGLHLITYLVPVAFPRTRPVHITLVTVFASLLVCGPAMAAALAVAAGLPGNRLAGSKEDTNGLLGGFQMACAVLVAGVFCHAFGLTDARGPLRQEMLGSILLVAFVFISAHTLAYYLGVRLARRKDVLPFATFLAFELGIYTVSVPFAVLMLLILKYVGIGGAVLFIVPVAVGAQAVRATVEVHFLRKQLAAMEEISREGIAESDLNDLFDRFFAVLQEVLHFERCTLWLVDMEDSALYVCRSTARNLREDSPRFAMGEGMIGQVAERGRPVILRNRAPEAPVPRSYDLPSALVIPLRARYRVIGVLELGSRLVGAYGPVHLQRVKSMVNQLAIAIENARLHAQVQEMAITDGLTGLLNHRRLQEVLREEIWRAERYRYALSLIMIDVDGFKHYNDTYGHPKGDILLKSLAYLIRTTIRQIDIAGRYGGEEFLVILPQTNKLQARFTAERIRLTVAEHRFYGHSSLPEVRKTISLGVASFPEDAPTQTGLIEMADQALYRAKQNGKNRVLTA